MWGCNHRAATAAGSLQHQHVGACRAKAGIIMALCPVVIIAGLLPSLLFFQSCFAVPPPPPEDWEKVCATPSLQHLAEPETLQIYTSVLAATMCRQQAVQDVSECSNAGCGESLLLALLLLLLTWTLLPLLPLPLLLLLQDVPSSSITVVRQTSQGASVYRYDTHGRLMQAPDCYRHKAGKTPPSPGKSTPGQQWHEGPASGGFTQHSVLGGGLGQRASSPAGLQSPTRPALVQYTGPGGPCGAGVQSNQGLSSPVLGREQPGPGPLTLSSSVTGLQQGSWGQHSPCSAAGGQYSPQHRQYSPQQSRQYSHQGSTAEEIPAADVYICLSPLKEAAGKAWPAAQRDHH